MQLALADATTGNQHIFDALNPASKLSISGACLPRTVANRTNYNYISAMGSWYSLVFDHLCPISDPVTYVTYGNYGVYSTYNLSCRTSPL